MARTVKRIGGGRRFLFEYELLHLRRDSRFVKAVLWLKRRNFDEKLKFIFTGENYAEQSSFEPAARRN